MSAPQTPAERLETLLGLSLGLFAVGVQVHELFATVGAWTTALFATALLVRTEGWRDELKGLWPLGAYVGWSLLGPLVLSQAPTGSGVARALDVLLLATTAWAVRALPWRSLARIGLVASAVLLVSCVAAALQFFGAWPSLETLSVLAPLKLPLDRVYEPVPGSEVRFMGGGLLLHRLRFANITAAFTVLAAALAFRVEVRRWLPATVAVVGLVSVALFPHARAATVSLVLALLVVAGAGAPRRSVGLGVGAAVVVLAALVVGLVPSVRTRFGQAMDGDGTGDRSLLLRAGLSALEQAPLAGVGLGRFKPADFTAPDAPESVRGHQGKAHNQFLTIAAEGGVPALVLFLALLALLAATSVRLLPASTASLGALAFFVALSALHDPLFHAESSMALFGVLGASVGLARRFSEAGPG